MVKYEPTVEDMKNAYLVAYGSEGGDILVNTLMSFISEKDIENVYARALYEVKQQINTAA